MSRTNRPDDDAPVVALIYLRVSTGKQATEGVSLGTQLDLCRTYAERQGWEIREQTFEDHVSGKRDDRPSYQALLTEIRRLRALNVRVAVVVYKLDRFGRHLVERARARDELSALDVDVHSVTEGGLTQSMQAGFLAVMAEEEVKLIAKRVHDNRTKIVKSGHSFPGRAAWGYMWQAATKDERVSGSARSVLVLDEPACGYVAEAFERVLHGASVRQTALWVATLSEEARGGGKTHTVFEDGVPVEKIAPGRHISPATLCQLLRNPVYIARPPTGSDYLAKNANIDKVLGRTVGHWPRIVSDEVWAGVQQVLANHQAPDKQGRRSLLSGWLRCPVCNARMVHAASVTGSGSRQQQYRCNGKALGAAGIRPPSRRGRHAASEAYQSQYCQQTVQAPAIEAAVMKQVAAVLRGLDRAIRSGADADVFAAMQDAWSGIVVPAGSDLEEMRTLKAEIAKLEARLVNLGNLRADGEMDKDIYQKAKQQADSELAPKKSALARLERLSRANQPPEFTWAVELARIGVAAIAAEDVTGQRRILGDLVETIVPERIARGLVVAHVVWTEKGEYLRQLASFARLLLSPDGTVMLGSTGSEGTPEEFRRILEGVLRKWQAMPGGVAAMQARLRAEWLEEVAVGVS